MVVEIEVFTSPTCPHCPRAVSLVKEFVDKGQVELVETNIGSPEGKQKADEFEIRAVPTLLVRGPGSEEPIGLRGVPSRDTLVKVIEIAEGRKEWKG
jgi:thioredoxin 1